MIEDKENYIKSIFDDKVFSEKILSSMIDQHMNYSSYLDFIIDYCNTDNQIRNALIVNHS